MLRAKRALRFRHGHALSPILPPFRLRSSRLLREPLCRTYVRFVSPRGPREVRRENQTLSAAFALTILHRDVGDEGCVFDAGWPTPLAWAQCATDDPEMRPSCETFAPITHFSRSSKIRDRTTREMGPACETFVPITHFSRSSKIRDRTTRESNTFCRLCSDYPASRRRRRSLRLRCGMTHSTRVSTVCDGRSEDGPVVRDIRTHNTFLSIVEDTWSYDARDPPVVRDIRTHNTYFSRSSKIRDPTTREIRPSCETFAPIALSLDRRRYVIVRRERSARRARHSHP